MRCLIVNADDFGLSPGVNEGIIEAYERGIVTSTSLMVRQAAAAEAAVYGRAQSRLSVGLHVDLGEWVYDDGGWVSVYEVVPLDDARAVKDEVVRQLAAFRDLMGRDPTHIDSHQHVHRYEPIRSVLIEMGGRLGVAVRQCSLGIGYCGDFYGQTGKGRPLPGAISVDRLLDILGSLPAGVTELGCHPGKGEGMGLVYGREREMELRTLCDARVRAAVIGKGIKLRSFCNIVA
jgi:predicted glycoside hydrolase/deacetylase ChbG (UPF0249 family)